MIFASQLTKTVDATIARLSIRTMHCFFPKNDYMRWVSEVSDSAFDVTDYAMSIP